MRYPDNEGYVWKTIAAHRDLVSRELGAGARCFIAYPRLTDRPAYQPRWLEPIAANFYDYSHENKLKIAARIKSASIKLIVFMGADSGSIDLKFLRKIGLRTVNTENDRYDHTKRDAVSISASKYVLRTLLKWRLHDLYIPNATAQFEFLQRYAKLPRSRMELIADGVDTDYFTPGGCDDAFAGTSLDRGRLWVMTASQARPEKRVDFVIEAARRVRSARPNLNIGFFHVGGGGCLATWRELASRVGLGSKYVFMEQKSDVLPYFRSASVFAHAAVRESFGLVIAEAMSCGLPVVATRSPGPQETIVDGHTGFVVEPDDLDGFVAALLTYIDNPELRKSHGTNGRERAVNLYSIQRQAREFADVLRRRFPDILG